MDGSNDLLLTAVPGIPLIDIDCDVVELILVAMAEHDLALKTGDILVIAQKIVSKSEGRMVNLAEVEPGDQAHELARKTSKDPRLVELILSESTEALRAIEELIIVAHRLGIVLANAGIDASNVAPSTTVEQVLLLPKDPDGSAREYRRRIKQQTGSSVGIIINDSVGGPGDWGPQALP